MVIVTAVVSSKTSFHRLSGNLLRDFLSLALTWVPLLGRACQFTEYITNNVWSAKGTILCKSIWLRRTTKNLNWIAEKSKHLLILKTKDNNPTTSCSVHSSIPCEICSSKIWAFGISATYGRAGGCKKAIADQSTEHICYRLYLQCTPRQMSERMYVFSLLSLPSLRWKK